MSTKTRQCKYCGQLIKWNRFYSHILCCQPYICKCSATMTFHQIKTHVCPLSSPTEDAESDTIYEDGEYPVYFDAGQIMKISGAAFRACQLCHVRFLRCDSGKHFSVCKGTEKNTFICRHCSMSIQEIGNIKLSETSCELGRWCCEQPLCRNCLTKHKSCVSWGNFLLTVSKCGNCHLHLLESDVPGHEANCKAGCLKYTTTLLMNKDREEAVACTSKETGLLFHLDKDKKDVEQDKNFKENFSESVFHEKCTAGPLHSEDSASALVEESSDNILDYVPCEICDHYIQFSKYKAHLEKCAQPKKSFVPKFLRTKHGDIRLQHSSESTDALWPQVPLRSIQDQADEVEF